MRIVRGLIILTALSLGATLGLAAQEKATAPGTKPAGLEIMLMQPTRSIQPGDQVLLTLHFGDGHSLTVQFEVRTPDGSPVKRASGSNVR